MTSPPAAPIPPSRASITYEEAVDLLRAEVTAAGSITVVSDRYGIKRQRLSDIIAGRARLSGEALEKLKFEIRYRRLI